MDPSRLHIAFFHPELSLGGAETVVIQAASALSSKGHRVWIVTGRVDVAHQRILDCAGVEVIKTGERFIRRRSHRFQLLRIVLHAIWSVFVFRSRRWRAPDSQTAVDVLVLDLTPHILGLASVLFPNTRRLVYCHFPDKLLPARMSAIRSLYRLPFDYLERQAFRRADVILANSRFTERAVASLIGTDASARLRVLWPGVEDPVPERSRPRRGDGTGTGDSRSREAGAVSTARRTYRAEENLVLCVGRFSPEKNQELAIRAFAQLTVGTRDGTAIANLCLVGASDAQSDSYFRKLIRLADSLGVGSRMTTVRNASEEKLDSLYRRASVLVHPAIDEHFGIVPVEAMLRRIPVVAVNSGGPCETVIDGRTGYLRPPETTPFAEAIAELLHDRKKSKQFGTAGRERAQKLFSLSAFQSGFIRAVEGMFGN